MYSDTHNHLKLDYDRSCWNCGKPTSWVELSFEAPLCPGPCTNQKWAEYEAAEQEVAERLTHSPEEMH